MRLELRNVNRVFDTKAGPVHAVSDVSLVVEPGEMVAITGRSGCGKTTLLNLMGGIDVATSGAVIVGGWTLNELTSRDLARVRRKSVGYVFQDYNLVPTLTAAENIAMPLELDKMKPRLAAEKAREALAMVIDRDVSDAFPDELSGGEQQRVAIARALVGDRSVLLADEPTGALDELTADSIMRLLHMRASQGATVVLVTHDPGQAAWADRVIRMSDGMIVETTERSSTPAELTR